MVRDLDGWCECRGDSGDGGGAGQVVGGILWQVWLLSIVRKSRWDQLEKSNLIYKN